MTPERWQQIREVLERAMELAPEQRASMLDRSCTSDPSLRQEVEVLLASSAAVRSNFLEPSSPFPQDTPADNGFGPDANHGIDAIQKEPTMIGRYQLVHRIGEGGMGEVWLAEQKEPVRRRIALKLAKSGLSTKEALLRFDSERQTLALMDHPSIAKVFDAGATPQGSPYFVMEYVAGIPITDYCDLHMLSVRQRLELFVSVCEGVQHAHQNAIIHRDLKPSNILVADVDGRALPKIIDFGVAKALTQKLTEDTKFTRTGVLVGTPEYMSPEQASSAGESIDTRTDIYSLGVIFYELLAGVRPISWRNVELEVFLRTLREDDPPKPSDRVTTLDLSKTAEVARNRRTAAQALVRQLRGELDSIALKALEKERSRRYASASDFAADIRRYLNHQAVLAVSPSLAYRTRKFARRHRGALAAASAILIVLVVASIVSVRQSIRANREAAVAQAVNDFLQNDLLAQAGASAQAGPTNKPDPDLKVRTALDRAAVRVAGKFDRQPEVEAAIRETMGKSYTDLGLYPKAQTELERALDLRRRVLGAEHPDTLKSMNNLALVYQDEGKYSQAETFDRQILEISRRVLGAEHPDTLWAMHNLGGVYYLEGKYAQAEALLVETSEIRRRVLGPEHHDTLKSMNNLAVVYWAEGKYAQAEAIFSQNLKIYRRVLGAEHPDTLACMHNLSMVYGDEGNYAQAETLLVETSEIRRRVLGAEHPYTLKGMNSLAIVYEAEGKYAQAEAILNQNLEISRRVLGAEHPDTLACMHNLSNVYGDEGKYAQAEVLFIQLLELEHRVLGPEHPAALNLLTDFASMYQRQGKYSSAESYAAQALAARRHALGSERSETMISAADLALAYVSLGKFDQSEPLAREALEFNQKNQPEDWQRFRAESLLGASLAGQKKYAEAEPLLLSGYQGMKARKDRIDVPDWYHLDLAQEWLVQLYQVSGKPEKAATWRKK